MPAGGGGATVALLDPKRANNLEIILSRLRLPFDAIRRAVIDLDGETRSIDAVHALQKCVPLPEEVELVRTADPATLGYAERFVREVGSLPRLSARLECFDYMHKLPAQIRSLSAEVGALTDASEKLVCCEPLRRLLAMLLRLGNALNAGSYRAGAEGFKLECLTRLAELKANSGQGSLLHFALSAAAGLEAPADAAGAAPADAAAAPLAPFTAELEAVRAAAKVSSAELLEEIHRLRKGLDLIGEELKHHTAARDAAPANGDAAQCEQQVASERFLLIMRPFFDGAAPQVDELQRAATAMGEAQGRMKTYFSEEAKANVDELYSRWATFLGQVETAVAHINDDRKKGRK